MPCRKTGTIWRRDGSGGDRDPGRRRLRHRGRSFGAEAQPPDHHDRHERNDHDCADRTPQHPERLPNPAPINARVFIIDILYAYIPDRHPRMFCRSRRACGSGVSGAAAPRSARNSCAPTSGNPRDGILSELSHKHDPGDGQRQDDDQADQRRGPSLVGAVIATLGSVIHRLPKAVATGSEHNMMRRRFLRSRRRRGEIDLRK